MIPAPPGTTVVFKMPDDDGYHRVVFPVLAFDERSGEPFVLDTNGVRLAHELGLEIKEIVLGDPIVTVITGDFHDRIVAFDDGKVIDVNTWAITAMGHARPVIDDCGARVLDLDDWEAADLWLKCQQMADAATIPPQ